jgi:hypothetical protein
MKDMDRNSGGLIEIARVSTKVKKPIWKKTIMTFMSDGSVWERTIFKTPKGRTKTVWFKLNQVTYSKYTRATFIRVFTGAGWKQE